MKDPWITLSCCADLSLSFSADGWPETPESGKQSLGSLPETALVSYDFVKCDFLAVTIHWSGCFTRVVRILTSRFLYHPLLSRMFILFTVISGRPSELAIEGSC